MNFINNRWEKIYKHIPEFKDINNRAKKEMNSEAEIDASIRWDNWRFDPYFTPNNGDMAIVFIEKRNKVKIEFAPEILNKSKNYQVHVLVHELAHIELGHLIDPENIKEEGTREQKKKEKQAEKFTRKFLKKVR